MTKKQRATSITISTLMIILSLVIIITGLCGCSQFGAGISELKGSLKGNTYTIDTFDNFGTLTMQTHGEKISIEPNIVNEYTYASDGWERTETLSSAITITIDGHQITSCGDTCIFYEDGLKPEYDFSVDKIDSSADGFTDNTAIAGMVNKVKNSFGKSVVVVIKSQTGFPLYAFSGDKVYWEIPEDLPKFTLLYIDGKLLYIHRANYQIIDKALLD